MTRVCIRDILLYSSVFLLGWISFAWYENHDHVQSERVFVYGTLQSPLVRLYACRCITPHHPATVSGWRRDGLTIHPATEHTVTGQILHVTPVELARFDRYERVPHRYARKQITTSNGVAWVYIKQ